MTERLSFGLFELVPGKRTLFKGTEVVRLGSRALDILTMLAERPGELITHRELLDRAWPDVTVEEANLRVQVAAIRKALDDGGTGVHYISTVSGRGYCFVADVETGIVSREYPCGSALVAPASVSLPPLTGATRHGDAAREVAELIMRQRLVSIIGAGGMGKTLCAMSVAQALTRHFDGICSVDLSTASNPKAIPGMILSAMGLACEREADFTNILDAVQNRRLLLVLDNCEQVIDAVAVLAEQLLAATKSLHLLATSREALRAQQERVYRMRPLAIPDALTNATAAEAMQTEAVQLFLESAAAGGHHVNLSDEDAPIVAAICRLLEGVPFAIECVASRLGVHGLHATFDLLSNGPSVPWPGRRSAPARHRSLQASFRWSFDLLSEQESCLLRRLVTFTGPFTMLGAQEVAVDHLVDHHHVANLLEALVDKSLICTSIHGKIVTYRLTHLTRAYLLESMSAALPAHISACSPLPNARPETTVRAIAV